MAAEMMHELLVYVPADNPDLQHLVTSIRGRFTAAAEECSVPAWPTAAVKASAAAQAVVFLRFCKAWCLVAGMCAFSDILPSSFLQRLVLGTIIGRGLIAHLRGSFGDVAVTTAKMCALVEMLPVDWFRAGTPKEASTLHELLSSFARHLEGQRVDALRHNLKEVPESAARIGALLFRIGDEQLGKRLARIFDVER